LSALQRLLIPFSGRQDERAKASVDQRMNGYDLISARARADGGNPTCGQILESFDIVLRLLRKLFEGPHLGNILAPSGHFLINRHSGSELGLIGRHITHGCVRTIGKRDVICRAYRNAFKTGQYVELGQHDVGQTIDLCRVAVDQGIEPAATTWPSRGDAELVTLRAQPLSRGVIQLGRERPFPDSGDVGLGNPDDTTDLRRADAPFRCMLRPPCNSMT
jgi:hypothetical protein